MFVATIDGIVSSLEPGHETGYEIALRHVKNNPLTVGGATDKRALQYGWATADAIIGGSRTLAAKPGMTWQPSEPDLRKLVQAKNRRIVKSVVTGTGSVDLAQPLFNPKDQQWQPVVFTTKTGNERLEDQAERLNSRGKDPLESTKIYPLGEDKVDLGRAVDILRKNYRAKLLDVQGGPVLAGQMIRERLIDEVRLTISPQIMGNLSSTGRLRPNFIAEIGFGIDDSPLGKLWSLGVSANHVFLRYYMNYRHR